MRKTLTLDQVRAAGVYAFAPTLGSRKQFWEWDGELFRCRSGGKIYERSEPPVGVWKWYHSPSCRCRFCRDSDRPAGQ